MRVILTSQPIPERQFGQSHPGSIQSKPQASDTLTLRFQGSKLPQPCPITAEMKSRWVYSHEVFDMVAPHANTSGCLVGNIPEAWGDEETSYAFLNAFTKLVHARSAITSTDIDAIKQQVSVNPDNTALNALEYIGKITDYSTNPVYVFKVGNQSFALKVFLKSGIAGGEYAVWRYFEAQGVYNSMRTYACNAGNSNRPSDRREQYWMLSELVTKETLKQSGRGTLKMTDIAEREGIDLGDPTGNRNYEVDAVHGVVVDAGPIQKKDPELSSAHWDDSKVQKNLEAWRKEGF